MPIQGPGPLVKCTSGISKEEMVLRARTSLDSRLTGGPSSSPSTLSRHDVMAYTTLASPRAWRYAGSAARSAAELALVPAR